MLQLYKLYALLRVHFLQKRRNKRKLFLECCFPIILMPIVLLTMTPQIEPDSSADLITRQILLGYKCTQIGLEFDSKCYDYAWTADGERAKDLSREAVAEMGNLSLYEDNDGILNAHEFADLDAVNTASDAGEQPWGLVHFGKIDDPSNQTVPYTIQTDFLDPTLLIRKEKYLPTGYVELQVLTSTGLTNALLRPANERIKLTLNVARFPTDGSYILQPRANLYAPVFLLYICFSLTVAMAVAVGVTSERAQRVSEALAMMGLHRTTYVLSWAVTGMIPPLLAIVVFLVSLAALQSLVASDPSLFAVLMFSQALMMVSFSFFAGHLFSNGLVASRATSLYLLATLGVFVAFDRVLLGSGIPYVLLSLLALPFPAVPFCSATMAYLHSDLANMRVSWVSAFHEHGDVGFGLITMWFGTIVYTLLTIYVAHVHPGKYGVPHHWLFCLRPSYWKRGEKEEAAAAALLLNTTTNDVVEMNKSLGDGKRGAASQDGAENEGSKVEISNLTKVFSSSSSRANEPSTVVAVDSLSLNLQEGEITCLLGPNGAGKTTTLNMLTGLYAPSAGDARIYGRSVRDDMTGIRDGNLGVCPQHTILISDLTAREHVWLAAALQGVPRQKLESSVDAVLKAVGIPEAAALQLAENLSGGYKRKLSVASACVGDAKFLCLDEPSTGMDPHARQSLWVHLQRHKKRRVILLTTHSMDEAELLADRIVIMAHGKIRAQGTPLELKRALGLGYTLTLTMDAEKFESKRTKKKIAAATKGLKKSATVTNPATVECLYDVPQGDKKHKLLLKVLPLVKELEAEEIITSHTLSMSTLDDVFRKTIQHADSEAAADA